MKKWVNNRAMAKLLIFADGQPRMLEPGEVYIEGQGEVKSASKKKKKKPKQEESKE